MDLIFGLLELNAAGSAIGMIAKKGLLGTGWERYLGDLDQADHQPTPSGNGGYRFGFSVRPAPRLLELGVPPSPA